METINEYKIDENNVKEINDKLQKIIETKIAISNLAVKEIELINNIKKEKENLINELQGRDMDVRVLVDFVKKQTLPRNENSLEYIFDIKNISFKRKKVQEINLISKKEVI